MFLDLYWAFWGCKKQKQKQKKRRKKKHKMFGPFLALPLPFGDGLTFLGSTPKGLAGPLNPDVKALASCQRTACFFGGEVFGVFFFFFGGGVGGFVLLDLLWHDWHG